jgi:hypothetical protein
VHLITDKKDTPSLKSGMSSKLRTGEKKAEIRNSKEEIAIGTRV